MTGTYYYDVSDESNMLTRLDRDNGRWDRYCGLTHHLKDQPCRHYITGATGDRYLYYPDNDSCCYCCSGDHGCGVMKYDWTSDATYVGVEAVNGVDTFKWNKVGSQDNFYWETSETNPADRIPVKTDMGAGSTTDFIQDYTVDTFTTSVDKSVFDLPETCSKKKKCPLTSVCTGLRGEIPEEFLQ